MSFNLEDLVSWPDDTTDLNLTPTEEVVEEENLDNQEEPVEEIPAAEKVVPPTPEAKPTETPAPTEEAVRLKAYYELLKDSGVLQVEDADEFDGTPEKLEEAFNKTRENLQKQIANQLWETLPEDFKPLLSYALKGGRNLEDYKTAMESNPGKFNLEDAEDQKRALYTFYKKTTSFDDDTIVSMVKRSEKIGELEVDAEKAVKQLRTLHDKELVALEEKAKEEAATQQKKIDTFNTNFKGAVEELEVPAARRQKIMNALYAPIKVEGGQTNLFTSINSSIMDNPKHLAQLLDIYLDYDPKKGFVMDRFKEKASTEAAKSFKERLEKAEKTARPSTTNDGTASGGKHFDWLKFNELTN